MRSIGLKVNKIGIERLLGENEPALLAGGRELRRKE
jgi:hypothetical protein